ncbi:hypothetical protein [Geomonas sp.]|uniref:hypothetical protein n=1 Tax=Geomonas sp. TaxID=2651584 RepID=UPI002B460AA8|nr:hypothetical protein [Geomonas sp.]HJV33650.1 hypothetical protein [Geomonas sp.]
MMPQSSFMIVADIDRRQETALRRLLATMNSGPGVVDPFNALVPFARFENLHFARFVILDDETANDITVYGLPRPDYPLYLVFLGDVDGDAHDFLEQLLEKAGDGLRQIFSHCKSFNGTTDLLGWMIVRQKAPAASYVNWIGRTARQVDEEEALHQALQRYLREHEASLSTLAPRKLYETVRSHVDAERSAGRIVLTPRPPTPMGWRVKNLLHLVGVPLLLLLALPFLLIYLPFFLVELRRQEKSAPVIAPRVDPAHADQLASQEDREVTNQFTAFGSLKPGFFRLSTIAFFFLLIDYAARHVFNRGRLARVTTIHFARWVFLDNHKRVLFASNYDGSLESYMDDFINKVGFGLNLAFSNGLGYPRTNWLILDGAKDELNFKRYLRRHQLPTQVWYNAHPGLTAMDKRRNMLIREGLEKSSMSDAQIQQWLDLF